jgi:hypothetical protein
MYSMMDSLLLQAVFSWLLLAKSLLASQPDEVETDMILTEESVLDQS